VLGGEGRGAHGGRGHGRLGNHSVRVLDRLLLLNVAVHQPALTATVEVLTQLKQVQDGRVLHTVKE